MCVGGTGDAADGEQSPTILLSVSVLDTVVNRSENCLAISDRAMWLQLMRSVLVGLTKCLLCTVLVLKSDWLSLGQEWLPLGWCCEYWLLLRYCQLNRLACSSLMRTSWRSSPSLMGEASWLSGPISIRVTNWLTSQSSTRRASWLKRPSLTRKTS